MKKHVLLTYLTFILILILSVHLANADAAGSEIKKTVNYIVCIALRVFEGIAVGLAALMIASQGIKWQTSEDSETRKAAKYTIFHVIIALMIIIVAVQLVNYFTLGTGIIEFIDCP